MNLFKPFVALVSGVKCQEYEAQVSASMVLESKAKKHDAPLHKDGPEIWRCLRPPKVMKSHPTATENHRKFTQKSR